MDNSFEFISFLNSLKTDKNNQLLESIENGFLVLYEEEIPQPQEQLPSSPFNVKDLKSIKSFAGRVKYIGSKLKKLGTGSSRSAYAIDDNTVLKIATNKKGVAQNEAEGDWGMHQMYDILPKLIDKDDEDIWLIMERATPIKNPTRFEELTHMSWVDYVACVNYEFARRISHGPLKMQKPAYFEKIWEDEEKHSFFISISDMMVNFDMSAGDLVRMSSYGEVNGHPVLLDAGLTQGIFDEFYKR